MGSSRLINKGLPIVSGDVRPSAAERYMTFQSERLCLNERLLRRLKKLFEELTAGLRVEQMPDGVEVIAEIVVDMKELESEIERMQRAIELTTRISPLRVVKLTHHPDLQSRAGSFAPYP